MANTVNVPIVTYSGAPIPSYAHPHDAGADLWANENVTIPPGERVLIRTGLAVAIPEGYAGFIHPRSGLAHKVGLSIVNTPGTIDAGYRGEIAINLINHDPYKPITINRGDRIAQLVIQPVVRAIFTPVDDLAPSARGDGGHGSTG